MKKNKIRSLTIGILLLFVGLVQSSTVTNTKPLPTGTYSQSCTECSVINNTLICSCPVFPGGPLLETALNFSACAINQNIDNSYGSLICGYSLPAGNYNSPITTSTSAGGNCTNCALDTTGTTLYCSCPTGANSLFKNQSSLKLATCNGQSIVNCNGRLTCGKCPLYSTNNSLLTNQFDSSNALNSCTNCMFDGTILSCLCPVIANGPSTLSTLAVNNCSFGQTTISNCNGSLACGPTPCTTSLTNPAPFTLKQIPQGSYSNQGGCRKCIFNGTVLTCSCPTTSTSKPSNITVLDTTSCQSGQDIFNCNGTLVCGSCATAFQTAQTTLESILEQFQNLEQNQPVVSQKTQPQAVQELLTAAAQLPLQTQQIIVPQLLIPYLQQAFLEVKNVLPIGSYQKTCDLTSCSYDGTKLTCFCPMTPPALAAATTTMNSSILQLPSSPLQATDIANCGGTLTYGNCPLPKGSYQASCNNNCTFDGITLSCSCPISLGSTSVQNTTLQPAICQAGKDITSCNGVLTCGACSNSNTPNNPINQTPSTTPAIENPTTPTVITTPLVNNPITPNPLANLPAGTYKGFGSCKDCIFEEGFLSCSCPIKPGTEGGPSTETELFIQSCAKKQDIANCDGELTCGSCPLPEGSYQEAGGCENCTFNGVFIYCLCPDNSGSRKKTITFPAQHKAGQNIANCNGVLTYGACPEIEIPVVPKKAPIKIIVPKKKKKRQ